VINKRISVFLFEASLLRNRLRVSLVDLLRFVFSPKYKDEYSKKYLVQGSDQSSSGNE